MHRKAVSKFFGCLLILIGLILGMSYVNVPPVSITVRGDNEQGKPKVQWNQTYGGTHNEGANALVQTTDGGFALAGFTYPFGVDQPDVDMWLVKTDVNGVMQWNRTYGGTNPDRANALVQTTDGGFALLGSTDGAGDADTWLVKTNADGLIQWNQTYAGTLYDYSSALIHTSDGGFALLSKSNTIIVKTDHLGQIQWNASFESFLEEDPFYGTLATSLIQSLDGGFAVAGYSGYPGEGANSGGLIKKNSLGATEWISNFGEGIVPESLVQIDDGSYVVAGRRTNGEERIWDYFLIKTDPSGPIEWNQTYHEQNDAAYALIQTNDGGFVLAGSASSDMWLVKTDSKGIMQWDKNYGSDPDASALVPTTDGGFALAGSIGGDMYLLKFSNQDVTGGSIPKVEFAALGIGSTIIGIFVTRNYLGKKKMKSLKYSRKIISEVKKEFDLSNTSLM
ncbi:MAG: hypothetical protein ACXAD7_27060, partial [Candidatus Kariarchaeaceae archaeon]